MPLACWLFCFLAPAWGFGPVLQCWPDCCALQLVPGVDACASLALTARSALPAPPACLPARADCGHAEHHLHQHSPSPGWQPHLHAPRHAFLPLQQQASGHCGTHRPCPRPCRGRWCRQRACPTGSGSRGNGCGRWSTGSARGAAAAGGAGGHRGSGCSYPCHQLLTSSGRGPAAGGHWRQAGPPTPGLSLHAVT